MSLGELEASYSVCWNTPKKSKDVDKYKSSSSAV